METAKGSLQGRLEGGATGGAGARGLQDYSCFIPSENA